MAATQSLPATHSNPIQRTSGCSPQMTSAEDDKGTRAARYSYPGPAAARPGQPSHGSRYPCRSRGELRTRSRIRLIRRRAASPCWSWFAARRCHRRGSRRPAEHPRPLPGSHLRGRLTWPRARTQYHLDTLPMSAGREPARPRVRLRRVTVGRRWLVNPLASQRRSRALRRVHMDVAPVPRPRHRGHVVPS